MVIVIRYLLCDWNCAKCAMFYNSHKSSMRKETEFHLPIIKQLEAADLGLNLDSLAPGQNE